MIRKMLTVHLLATRAIFQWQTTAMNLKSLKSISNLTAFYILYVSALHFTSWQNNFPTTTQYTTTSSQLKTLKEDE